MTSDVTPPAPPASTAVEEATVDPFDTWAERHHWLNALVGTLDAAFRLTEDEQFFVLDIVSRLLDSLDIPFRGEPAQLPATVAQEAASGLYSEQLAAPRDSGLIRPVRPVNGSDMVVSVGAWRNALLGMLLTAYPGLEPVEKMVAAQVLDDLLAAVGVPDRRATFFPTEVVAAYRDYDLQF
jgi:hypothetical protein